LSINDLVWRGLYTFNPTQLPFTINKTINFTNKTEICITGWRFGITNVVIPFRALGEMVGFGSTTIKLSFIDSGFYANIDFTIDPSTHEITFTNINTGSVDAYCYIQIAYK